MLFCRITKSVDVALQLSQTYEVEIVELGHALVLYFFSIVIGLVDSILDDWGLQMTSVDGASGTIRSDLSQNMDVNSEGNHFHKRNEHREEIIRKNSFMALEVLGKLTDHRKAMVLLRLVHLNMYVLLFYYTSRLCFFFRSTNPLFSFLF